jgi:hypothetical protein
VTVHKLVDMRYTGATFDERTLGHQTTPSDTFCSA